MDIQSIGANTSYQPQPSPAPKKDTSSEEVTVASTDKVDVEIERLKAKQAQLLKKISSSREPDADLQRQLAQIENELRQKDNDTYRRQHTEFSTGVDIKA